MNKLFNKRKISILSYIFIVVIFFSASIENIFATTVTCNAKLKEPKLIVEGDTASEGGKDKACGGARFCYSSMATQGLRFAIVDKNGKRVPGTKLKDYWFKRYSVNADGSASYDHELDFTVQDRGYDLADYTIYKAKSGKETLTQEYRDLDKKGEFEHVRGKSSLQTIRDNTEDISSVLKGILECKVDGKQFIFSYANEHRNTTTAINAYDSSSYEAVVKILLDYGKSNTYLEDLYEILDPSGIADLSNSFIQVEPLYQFSYRDTQNSKVYNYMGSYAEVWYMTHYHPTNDVPAKTATPNAYDALDGTWLMVWRSYNKNADGSPNEFEAVFTPQDSTADPTQGKNIFTDDFVLYAFNNALHPKSTAKSGVDIPKNFYANYKSLQYDSTGKGQDSSVRDYARIYYNVDTTNQGHVVGGYTATYNKNGIQQNVPAIAVSFIKLSQLFNCNDEAKKFDKKYSSATISDVSQFLKDIISKVWDSKDLNIKGVDKVKSFTDAISFLYKTFDGKNYKSSFNLGTGITRNNFILYKTFGFARKSNFNYCGTTKCSDALKMLKTEKKFNESNLKKLSQLYQSYDKLDPEYLKDFYGDIEEKSNYLNYASCDSTPKCAVTPVDATCSKTGSGKSFTISDFTYQGDDVSSMKAVSVNNAAQFATLAKQGCLKEGIAYNYFKGTSSTEKVKTQNAYETSYYGHVNSSATTVEEKYGTAARCWESTTFSFPGSVKNIEAGTIFMWGIDNTEETVEKNKFGTMTIKRYCTVPDYYLPSGVSQRRISSDWAIPNGSPITEGKLAKTDKDIVNTNIVIHYQQAIPSDVTLAKSLKNVDIKTKVQLGRLKTELYSKNYDNYSTNVDEYNDIYFSCGQYGWDSNPVYADGSSKCADKATGKNDPYAITCYSDSSSKGTKCSKLGDASNPPVIYVEATYDILYQDKFKWYSDKSENYTKKMKDSIKDGVDNAKYVSLGYGLPTSFVTPPLPKNEDYYYGYSLSSSNSGGYMYAEITNVGTKKGSSYHFDKLMLKIDDDDTSGTHSGLIYSCGFNIQNRLYCYECDHKIITKDCKKGICGVPNGSTPKDIDVVFRTVELVDSSDIANVPENISKIFPGRSGKGREIGANWRMVAGEEIDDNLLDNFFSEKTYDKEPKYKIDLTSSLIQEIRKSNKKESYTSMSNYTFKKFDAQYSKSVVKNHSTLSIECSEQGDSTKCFKQVVYVRRLYSLASVGNNTPYEYTRASSSFLSDLISKGELKGTCATEADTVKRAEMYAENLGC